MLSELSPLTPAAPWTFPRRNRIMAGLSQATILIEAGEKSGTLITARLAVDYNRELLAVPGNIFLKYLWHPSILKLGATLVTDAGDILDVLGIKTEPKAKQTITYNLTTEEEKLYTYSMSHKKKISSFDH